MVRAWRTTTAMASLSSSSGGSGNGNIPSVPGIMMILSPAKTLDLEPLDDAVASRAPAVTEPSCDARLTKRITAAMETRSAGDLARLLGLSAKLSATAKEYWSDFSGTTEAPRAFDAKPAAFSFSGPAYQGLRLADFLSADDDDDVDGAAALTYLQSNLRILDPLYGVLRPMDAIRPYRLEMGCKGVLDDDNDKGSKRRPLSAIWRPSATRFLKNELETNDGGTLPRVLLNLASDEYAAAVDGDAFESSRVRYVKVVFREEGRVVSVHAKRARGSMARFLAKRAVTDLDGVKEFNVEGYGLVEDESSGDDNVLVFDRKKQTPAKKKGTSKKKAAEGTDTKPTAKRSRRAKKS